MKLYQFPLIKIALWFILGISISHYLTISIAQTTVVLMGSIGTAFLGHYLSRKQLKNHLLFSIAIAFTFVFTGIFISKIHKDDLQPKHFTHFNYQKDTNLKVHITERLKSSTKYHRYILAIQKMNQQTVSGKIVLNIKKSELQNNFYVGQVLLVHGNIHEHFKTTNPNQFDYGRYLENKNIYGQLFSTLQDIKPLPYPIRDFRFYTDQFRQRIQTNLEKRNFPEKELAVVNALILGQQQDIAPETLKSYQSTGVVHILSVSGLHVGILLYFLHFILNYLPKNRLGTYGKLLLTLVGLWSFACVAGLAPSVVRATVMFSCIAIGLHLKRLTNIYNTTVASLIIILVFEPAFLFDIGFQLSYLAVFSLISLEPILSAFYKPKYKITRFFWKLFTVSVAAQLGTLPLSLYYFHQFPSLFFIANLVVIPLLEFIIMPLGALVVVLGYFDIVPKIMTDGLAKSIQWMNLIINQLASWDTFVLTKIPFTIGLLVVAYLLLILFFRWLHQPKFNTALYSLLTLLAFQLLWMQKQFTQNKEELIVFHAKKQTLIAQQKNKQLTIYSDSLIEKESFEARMIDDYAMDNFTEVNAKKALNNVLFQKQKRILILNNPKIYPNVSSLDILILSHSPKLNLERFLQRYHPKLVIADASNYKNYIAWSKKTCAKLKIPFHSTYEKGFYRLN